MLPGFGFKIVSTVGSNANLATVARDIGLEPCVITAPGHRGEVSQNTLATTLEALLAAIYRDSGKDEAVKTFMTAIGIKANRYLETKPDKFPPKRASCSMSSSICNHCRTIVINP